MSWNTIKLRFDSDSPNLKQRLEDGLEVEGVAIFRHEVQENDYVRKGYRSKEGSQESYIMIIEGFGEKVSRARNAIGYRTEVTIMFDQPGHYDSVVERINENAKKLGLRLGENL